MNINTPKISIIVPIYNVEAYLDRCMQSLIMQTLREIEIIMVDDESPDNCPTICDNYAKQDSRIKVIHKKNGGLGFARNSGLEIATGKYIAFLDSDDFVDISMYETLYNTATQYNLDTVFCGFNQYSSYNIKSKQEVSTFTIYEGKDIKEKVLLNMIAGTPEQKEDRTLFMSVWHAIYSNKLIQKNNIRFCSEREIISEDIVFDIDYLTQAQRVAYIPDCLYYYCLNESSLSRIFRKDRNDKIITMYEKLIMKAEEFNWQNDEKLRIMRLFIGYSRNAMIDLCNSNIKFREKIKLLHQICSNDIWIEILNKYPYQKLPTIYALFTILIKHKYYLSIYILSHLKKTIF